MRTITERAFLGLEKNAKKAKDRIEALEKQNNINIETIRKEIEQFEIASQILSGLGGFLQVHYSVTRNNLPVSDFTAFEEMHHVIGTGLFRISFERPEFSESYHVYSISENGMMSLIEECFA